MEMYDAKVNQLLTLPQDTLGYDIAACLKAHKLQLVPNFESHDLKHVLLGYEMTPKDEIRMQAFMLGNGNYSLPCFAILFFGILLLPNLFMVLYNDFKSGRNSMPISSWTIEEYCMQNTMQLRKTVSNYSNRKPTISMKHIITIGACSLILSGIAGMLFCLPYLFSSSIPDLIGAGFPFVGGCILTVGGLLTLTKLPAQLPRANDALS